MRRAARREALLAVGVALLLVSGGRSPRVRAARAQLTPLSYWLSLAPGPAAAPAGPGGAIGSTVMASLFHVATVACVPGGVVSVGATPVLCNGAAGIASLVAGAESGSVTFATSSGVFGSTSPAAGAGGQQVYQTHCGQLAATAPTVLLPVVGLPFNLSLFQCLSASATLYGGGMAGTAAVTATFVGDLTGSVASDTTTVALSPTPAVTTLTAGCNEVVTVAATVAGTLIATVVGQVQPGGVAQSAWVYSNSLHAFLAGYFATVGAPVDVSTIGPNQSLFICLSSGGSLTA